ncbi:deuterosome assembly protein 1 isoform X3 [Vidua chalybeata]|uniref:deuterosome assembly protein 1 isoform X3 n=1 Tax=Vidua chalybeata TaxID=81927 RepID=UPI0023A89DAB|nr:deuterosome assembly protein 1 isoform X3 [Vidua chalybeata]
MEEDLEVFQEQAVTKASPCEAELQELVHQIDVMVNRKQVEWERKMRALEAKMDIQDQELASAQSKLDQKGQEVGLLQQELENLQKTKNEMAQSYETQLQALKSQFSKLIHSYEKLQSHQLKQKKLQSRDECEENLETSSNPRNLYVKLEELKTKSQQWEKNGTTCGNNPSYVDRQPKLLPEKCNLFQNMEADISEMRNELQSRDGLWRRIQLECQKLYTELFKIKEYKDMQEIQLRHQSSCVQLTEQLETKTTELLLFAESQEHQEEELNKIRNHVYQEEQSHCSEQERMKTEISDLTEELHQKEITIATIMEKASLLERQLKMELETKHKLLTKQQLLEFHYQVIKSENTHLKEMVENQECESCMCIDLCNKEHGNFTASLHKMKHENLRLQNSLVKPQNDTETLILGCMDTYRETEHSYQTHSKMQEERGHEKKIDYKSPLPPVGCPLGLPGPFPAVGRTGSFQSPAYNEEEIKLSSPPEMSFLATTEKFFQEEEKHAREFEERLNSHIEELQRYSENTLKKYARMQQNRHT